MSRFTSGQVKNLRSWGVEPRPEEIIKPPNPYQAALLAEQQNQGAYERVIAGARGPKGVLENLLDLGWRPPELR